MILCVTGKYKKEVEMVDCNAFNNEEAYIVGKKQKAILWAFFASLIFPPALYIMIFFVYGLAKAEKKSLPGLWTFAILIPLVNIFCLLTLIQNATKILRAKGVRVGLMGANERGLENLSPEKNNKPITAQSI